MGCDFDCFNITTNQTCINSDECNKLLRNMNRFGKQEMIDRSKKIIELNNWSDEDEILFSCINFGCGDYLFENGDFTYGKDYV